MDIRLIASDFLVNLFVSASLLLLCCLMATFISGILLAGFCLVGLAIAIASVKHICKLMNYITGSNLDDPKLYECEHTYTQFLTRTDKMCNQLRNQERRGQMAAVLAGGIFTRILLSTVLSPFAAVGIAVSLAVLIVGATKAGYDAYKKDYNKGSYLYKGPTEEIGPSAIV